MSFLYSLLYTCAFIILFPYFLMAGLIRRRYLSSVPERLGRIGISSAQPSCWIHAVSVGEFLAAKPLIQRIRKDFPDLPLFLSSTTITGRKLAAEFLPEASLYFPFDWRRCIRKVFRSLNPRIILVMETEIWPNFLWEAQEQKVPVVLVNGRLSDRSFSRYKMISRFLPHFDLCLMQTRGDANRMTALGMSPEKIRLMGNLKYEFRPATISPELRSLISGWKGTSMLWICGSTMRGEEEMLLDVFRKQGNGLKLMIAPRHPERFTEVTETVAKSGLRCSRRTQGVSPDDAVLILDTIGELAACYELADLVFIGGTLAPFGGHNPIEPAYFGKAIVAGPYFANFQQMFEEFRSKKAIWITADLADAVQTLLSDTEQRDRMGRAAGEMIRENQGATDIVLQAMKEYLHAGSMVERSQELPLR